MPTGVRTAQQDESRGRNGTRSEGQQRSTGAKEDVQDVRNRQLHRRAQSVERRMLGSRREGQAFTQPQCGQLIGCNRLGAALMYSNRYEILLVNQSYPCRAFLRCGWRQAQLARMHASVRHAAVVRRGSVPRLTRPRVSPTSPCIGLERLRRGCVKVCLRPSFKSFSCFVVNLGSRLRSDIYTTTDGMF